MGVQKPIHLAYVTDGVYHIYKFSNYGHEKIKLVEAGIAFAKGGNYSAKYKKLMKKYNIDQYPMHYTANTLIDFFERIYLDVENGKIDMPYIAYEIMNLHIKKFIIEIEGKV